jgi:hypothetical protein
VRVPILIAARLSIRSSFAQAHEEPAAGDFDTVQFHLPTDGAAAYRVRTFAIDHDIHVHRIDGLASEEAVRAHLERVYGDVLASVHSIPVDHRSTEDLLAAGITFGHLEVTDDFAFWNPDGERYFTQSNPTTGPAAREGMREVVYLGGIARFWVPESWQVEMNPDDGGRFYDPDLDATLRLNVLTFDTSAATGPPVVRLPRKPRERQLDAGTLPNGCDLDSYEFDSVEDGEPIRIRYWQIVQLLPGQCRIYLFSFAWAVAVEAQLADVLAMVDREVRAMVPYPEPVS